MSAEDTGSTPAAPMGVAAGTAAQSPTAPPPSPQTVTIPFEQLQTFTQVQTRLAQIEAEQRQREDTGRAEQVKLMAAKGQVEEALQKQQEESRRQLEIERTQRAAIEERAKRYALDGELSKVLASQPLVPGGAEQLTQLWRSQFQVEPQGESFHVRTPTFQSVGDFVGAQLARPEYAHFIRAANPGGGTAGTTGGHQAAPTPANPATPQAPKNFGEAIILQMQEMAKSQPSDSRLNPAVAMGLNSRSMVRGCLSVGRGKLSQYAWSSSSNPDAHREPLTTDQPTRATVLLRSQN